MYKHILLFKYIHVSCWRQFHNVIVSIFPSTHRTWLMQPTVKTQLFQFLLSSGARAIKTKAPGRATLEKVSAASGHWGTGLSTKARWRLALRAAAGLPERGLSSTTTWSSTSADTTAARGRQPRPRRR